VDEVLQEVVGEASFEDRLVVVERTETMATTKEVTTTTTTTTIIIIVVGIVKTKKAAAHFIRPPPPPRIMAIFFWRVNPILWRRLAVMLRIGEAAVVVAAAEVVVVGFPVVVVVAVIILPINACVTIIIMAAVVMVMDMRKSTTSITSLPRIIRTRRGAVVVVVVDEDTVDEVAAVAGAVLPLVARVDVVFTINIPWRAVTGRHSNITNTMGKEEMQVLVVVKATTQVTVWQAMLTLWLPQQFTLRLWLPQTLVDEVLAGAVIMPRPMLPAAEDVVVVAVDFIELKFKACLPPRHGCARRTVTMKVLPVVVVAAAAEIPLQMLALSRNRSENLVLQLHLFQ